MTSLFILILPYFWLIQNFSSNPTLVRSIQQSTIQQHVTMSFSNITVIIVIVN